MKLLLDLGNTRLKWALADGGTLSPTRAEARDAFDVAFTAIADVGSCDRALLSSVAPSALTAQLTARLHALGIPWQHVASPRSTAHLQLAYAEPSTLGVDRWLCLLAAADQASLVVSCGSALTIDLVDGQRCHRGGLIAASPERMREALAARIPHLQGIGSVSDFATSTADALASGSVLTAVALIERQYQRAAELLGSVPRLLLTGGGRTALLPFLSLPLQQREQLLFEGMLQWLRDYAD